MITRLVAGREKVLAGILAVLQAYLAAVDWLVDPEKAALIGLIGVAQFWLTGDSPKPQPAPTAEPDSITRNPILDAKEP